MFASLVSFGINYIIACELNIGAHLFNNSQFLCRRIVAERRKIYLSYSEVAHYARVAYSHRFFRVKLVFRIEFLIYSKRRSIYFGIV